MKSRMVLGSVALLLCVSVVPVAQTAPPAAKEAPAADLGVFLKELMQFKMVGDRTELAILLPFEFLIEAGLAEGGQTRQALEKEVAFLKSYLTIIVQCSYDRADGSSVYSPERDVRARSVLLLPDGTEVRPLAKVPPMVGATMAAMKVMMASEGDAGGANMHVLVFPSKDKKGKPIIDAKKRGKVRLRMKPSGRFPNSVLTWRTPFDSIVKAPPCGKCKEAVSAKWSFCPWCGNKLPK